MAAHPSILAWGLPWTEKPGGLLQSMGRTQWDRTQRLSTQQRRGGWTAERICVCQMSRQTVCHLSQQDIGNTASTPGQSPMSCVARGDSYALSVERGAGWMRWRAPGTKRA